MYIPTCAYTCMYNRCTCFLLGSQAVRVASSSACSPTEHWPGTAPGQISNFSTCLNSESCNYVTLSCFSCCTCSSSVRSEFIVSPLILASAWSCTVENNEMMLNIMFMYMYAVGMGIDKVCDRLVKHAAKAWHNINQGAMVRYAQ